MNDTFTRLVAFKMRWAKGDLSLRLTQVIAGVIPDAIVDAARQVMRALLPLPGTPLDAVPSLLARFGLPPYGVGLLSYSTQLARLQSVLDTQSRAGSTAQMIAELLLLAIPDADIEPTDRGFWIVTTTLVSPPTVGEFWILDDGVCIGGGASTVARTRSVLQMLAYFRPAADFFEGFKEP